MDNIKTGKYKHFKGDVVEVLGTALHSETLENFVVYKHITGEKRGEENFWVRPVDIFLEEVDKEGNKVKRFQYVEE